uniref:Uncharacterized protein n=1 Tax=Geoglobus ahangari TaxID=113653 RepID=A0A7C3UE60_9EURY
MWELLIKDIKVELRRGFEILASVSFVLISSLLLAQTSINLVASFYVLIVFLAVFISTTSFVREMDSKTLEGLKLLPTPSYVIFLEKAVFSFLLIIFQGFLGMLFLSLFSNSFELLGILPLFVVFSLYISVISSFSSALVMFSEGRSFLTPMIVFVFTAPIIPTLLKGDVLSLAVETVAVILIATILATFILES